MGPRVKELVQRVARIQPIPQYDRPEDPAWLLMKAILRHWQSELTAPALLVTLPLYQHIEGMASAEGYRARFAELHDPPGLTVHDTLGDLQQYSRAERRGFRFAIDNHYTRAGHLAVAKSLAPAVRQAMQGGTQEAAGARATSSLR